jgi:hypothetical protein
MITETSEKNRGGDFGRFRNGKPARVHSAERQNSHCTTGGSSSIPRKQNKPLADGDIEI